MLPFATSADEVELAVRLGIPLYGADPALDWLGTKSGSRRVFADEGVSHARGFAVASERDVLDALRELDSNTAVHKLDRGVGGLGNALVDERRAIALDDLAGALELEDTEASTGGYLAALADQGGIVEERIEGTDFRSPSVQLRLSPSGQVEILSPTIRCSAGLTARRTSGAASRPTLNTRRRSRSKRSRSVGGWPARG